MKRSERGGFRNGELALAATTYICISGPRDSVGSFPFKLEQGLRQVASLPRDAR